MSVAGSQRRTFLQLASALRPHWRRDPALPARLQALLAAHRSFGARDRRLYRELLYTTLRHLPVLEPLLDSAPDEAVRQVAWLCVDGPATAAFRAAFATGVPPPVDPVALLPGWFHPHAPALFEPAEAACQLRRAALWLRLQTDDPAGVTAEFAALGWTWRESAVLPGALALAGDVDVTRTAAWRGGRCEVQDLGSQLILAAAAPAPGGRWFDACAGAGGKALQLARLLGPAGTVDAHDVRPTALAELRARAARAGQPRIRTVTAPDPAGYDGVLIDAPCSGSGTWRRAPHLKWVTTEAHVTRAAERQLRLLDTLSRCVRPGGRLLYATCSLSRRENQDVVAAFRAAHPEFTAEPPAATFGGDTDTAGLTIWPSRHDTDGFFVACLRRG